MTIGSWSFPRPRKCTYVMIVFFKNGCIVLCYTIKVHVNTSPWSMAECCFFFGFYRRCRSRSDCVREKPVKLNFRLTCLIDLDGKKSHPAVIYLFISIYLPSLPVAHLSDAPRRRLVVTGDNTRIQDETTESSAWSFNVLGL